MKRSFFRAFGIACFLIGALLYVVDRYDLPISITASENKTDQKEVEKLKKQLEDANKLIKELESKLEEKNEKDKETTEAETSKDETKEDEIVKGTLYIYSGLSIQDVAKKLKEMGIVKNSVEMELFLAQPEYSRSLQIGQYELNSSMSVEEIANIITGKKNENKTKEKK